MDSQNQFSSQIQSSVSKTSTSPIPPLPTEPSNKGKIWKILGIIVASIIVTFILLAWCGNKIITNNINAKTKTKTKTKTMTITFKDFFSNIKTITADPSAASNVVMTADQAVRLVNAWEGKSDSTNTARLSIAINGDFSHHSGGAFFHFEESTHRLVVSGLVGQQMLQFTAAQEPWEELQFYASHEQATLGEGTFQVITAPFMDLAPPVLLLRKSFADGSIENGQFIMEVRWLLEWATHWRTLRLLEIYSADPSETILRKGAAYVEFAKRHRPRPW